jgi:hypothetical protein
MSGQQVTASGPLNAMRRTQAYVAALGLNDANARSISTLPVARLVEAQAQIDPVLGYASTTAQCSGGSTSCRKARDSAYVVSGSSPWMPENTNSRHSREGRQTSSGSPTTDRPYNVGDHGIVPHSGRGRRGTLKARRGSC